MRLITAVFLVLGLFAPNVQACKRVGAALRKDGEANLFFGNYYKVLDEANAQDNEGHTPEDWMVYFPDAAFVFSKDHKEYFFSGKDYYTEDKGFAPEPASDFGEFFKEGLDAAGNLNGATVFFKGCQYVKTLPSGSFSAPQKMPGLPCDVDAALTEGNNLLVFKDDMMYVVYPTSVMPPIPTHLMISLDDVQLCQEGEDAEEEVWKR